MAKLIRWAVRSATAFGFLFAAVTFLPVLNPWISALRTPWSDTPGDILIVLAGESSNDGVLGLTSYWRAFYAIEEWRHGHYQSMILSGGGGAAEAMRDFVVTQGVPATAIRLEAKSGSTRENALYLAQLLKDDVRPKVLLTSDYHSRRAYRAFLRCGLAVSPRTAPDAIKAASSPATRWQVFEELSVETTKFAWYWLHNWV